MLNFYFVQGTEIAELKAVARAVVEAEAVVMGCVWVCVGVCGCVKGREFQRG